MSDTTKSRIFNAAGPIFAEKGFQAATVRDICRRAEVNVAAVNYYFGDKQRLYVETIKQAREHRAEQAPLPEWTSDTPAETKLRDFVSTILSRMLGREDAPWQVRLMMREILQPTAACERLVEEYFRPLFNVLLDILDDILPPSTPAHKRNQIGFSIVGQCFFYRAAGGAVGLLIDDAELQNHYGITSLAEHISQVSLASLGLAKPLGAKPRGESPAALHTQPNQPR